ncbi:MAG TPA: Uma2 family endonuclease [Chloroflexota bacterium]
MVETKTPVTADELFCMPEDGWRYELRAGELLQMVPPGYQHGRFSSRLNVALGAYVLAQDLGDVVIEVGFRLSRDPDTVRAPDIAFVSRARIPAGELPIAYWEGAPDLAVEMISPSESAEDIREKIDEYIRAGARLVWILFPRLRSAEVWRADGSWLKVGPEAALSGEDVVPGFSIPLAQIFGSA